MSAGIVSRHEIVLGSVEVVSYFNDAANTISCRSCTGHKFLCKTDYWIKFILLYKKSLKRCADKKFILFNSICSQFEQKSTQKLSWKIEKNEIEKLA